MIVSYDAPNEDHSVLLSGSYTGNFNNGEDGMYLDAYVDNATGETRLLGRMC